MNVTMHPHLAELKVEMLHQSCLIRHGRHVAHIQLALWANLMKHAGWVLLRICHIRHVDFGVGIQILFATPQRAGQAQRKKIEPLPDTKV